MKCERKNAKVEKFEDSVDGIMDWIYNTEMLMSVMVESTHAAVAATVEKLEVGCISNLKIRVTPAVSRLIYAYIWFLR